MNWQDVVLILGVGAEISMFVLGLVFAGKPR